MAIAMEKIKFGSVNILDVSNKHPDIWNYNSMIYLIFYLMIPVTDLMN